MMPVRLRLAISIAMGSSSGSTVMELGMLTTWTARRVSGLSGLCKGGPTCVTLAHTPQACPGP